MPSPYLYPWHVFEGLLSLLVLVATILWLLPSLWSAFRRFARSVVDTLEFYEDPLLSDDDNSEPDPEEERRQRRNAQQRAYRARKKAERLEAKRLAEAKRRPKPPVEGKPRLERLLDDDDL